MLHFAYGSNMDRAIMRRYAPSADPLGVGVLAHHRFMITANGYASIAPARAQTVHGVLWRLTPRDRVTLDLWENVASGIYRPKIHLVRWRGKQHRALVYIARASPFGRPKAGYMELVLAAAQVWNLPADYVALLQHWTSERALGAGTRNLKEFGWR
jgi:AIG2-like family